MHEQYTLRTQGPKKNWSLIQFVLAYAHCTQSLHTNTHTICSVLTKTHERAQYIVLTKTDECAQYIVLAVYLQCIDKASTQTSHLATITACQSQQCAECLPD